MDRININSPLTATMIQNSDTFGIFLEKKFTKICNIYSKRPYTHWLSGYGIPESELCECIEEIASLKKDNEGWVDHNCCGGYGEEEEHHEE